MQSVKDLSPTVSAGERHWHGAKANTTMGQATESEMIRCASFLTRCRAGHPVKGNS